MIQPVVPKKTDLTAVDPQIAQDAWDKLTKGGMPLVKVQLHQACTIDGITETSFYTQHDKKRFTAIIWTQQGVFCEYKGNKFVVPLANVVAAYL